MKERPILPHRLCPSAVGAGGELGGKSAALAETGFSLSAGGKLNYYYKRLYRDQGLAAVLRALG